MEHKRVASVVGDPLMFSFCPFRCFVRFSKLSEEFSGIFVENFDTFFNVFDYLDNAVISGYRVGEGHHLVDIGKELRNLYRGRIICFGNATYMSKI